VLEEVDSGWFIGEVLGEEGRFGMFPATYCSVVEQPRRMLKPPSPEKDGKGGDKGDKGDVFTDMEEQVSLLSLRRPATVGFRAVSGRTASSTSIITPVATPGKKKPPPPPVSRGSKPISTTGSSSTIAASTTTAGNDSKCHECGCNEFQANVFKKGSCNNCFHVHVG